MIRQRVTRHGVIFPLPPSSELPGCTMARELVGVPKEGPVRKWLAQKRQWDQRFASAKRKVHKRLVQDLAVGYEGFGEGELPPPSALAGRRRKKDGEGAAASGKKRTKSMGLALWSLWGSKHDKMTMDREVEADRSDRAAEVRPATSADGAGARSFGDIAQQDVVAPTSPPSGPGDIRSRSRRRMVTYDRQDQSGGDGEAAEDGGATDGDGAAAAVASASGGGSSGQDHNDAPQFLTPGYGQHEVGVGSTGKRAYVDGIAVPFSIKKEAETASMMTLNSNMSQCGPLSPRASTSRPMSPATAEDLLAPMSPATAEDLLARPGSPPEGQVYDDGDGQEEEAEGEGKGKGKKIDVPIIKVP